MSDVLTKDLVAYDPLSEITRKERRFLLGLAALGIALVKVPLVPTKFAALGIEFAPINQSVLLQLYAFMVAFFLTAFLIYAFTDYVAWRRSQVIHYREYIRQDALTRNSLGLRTNEEVKSKLNEEGCQYVGLASFRAASFASSLRAVFEFLVPVAISGYSIVSLLMYKS